MGNASLMTNDVYDFEQRLVEYDKPHCWQYNIRLNNLENDLKKAKLTKEFTDTLTVSDFNFVVAHSKLMQGEIRKFIEEHEWLGKPASFSEFYFAAFYKNILAGVIVMGVPNAYSYPLGTDRRDVEILINRGACISWSPKNLASSLMSFAMNYVAKNSKYRVFVAYSDPTAKELGTIYQACNFYYIGNGFGAEKKYVHPYKPSSYVSDRWFRTRCAYKRFAIDLGIVWDDSWLGKGRRVVWEKVPNEIEKELRDYSKMMQAKSDFICLPTKHKYAYVLGATKHETKKLRKEFENLNKTFPYPKNRGL